MSELSPVLVTGASRGIGAAVVRHLVDQGRVVVGVARDASTLARLGSELGPSFVPLACDLADRDARASLVDVAASELGTVPRAFVSAAGNAEYGTALDVDAESMARHLELHVLAAHDVARALARRWVDAGVEGAIVAISSTLATRPAPFTLPYAVAKGALEALVRGLALELAPHRIRVNGVSPGLVDTLLVRAPRPDGLEPDERLAAIAAIHPLGRLGKPEEIAATVVHALDARFMTGSILVVDGGLSIG